MSKARKPEKLETSREVIKELGGYRAVAALLGCDPGAVSNWGKRGLPPETFYALTTVLNARNLYAPPSLWRQHELAS